ncbi:MAG: hypothetical protein AB7Q23_10080 [Hyphomonadaceae bacterium]
MTAWPTAIQSCARRAAVAAWSLAALTGCATPPINTQNSPLGCTSIESRAFDFWLGEWDIAQRILNADGSWLELPAQTAVNASPNGCVLTEHWQGDVRFFWEGMTAAEPLFGYSVRTYDPSLRQWRIYWMDSHAPRFESPYVGNFENGRGEFRREFATPDGARLGRIVFDNITPETVNWELSVSSDEGQSWTALWIMEMQRRY